MLLGYQKARISLAAADGNTRGLVILQEAGSSGF
jgi:hypothetical protein